MKTAVVTGGGSGIGLAVARRLRADGLDVATIDLRPSDTDLSFTADVTDRSQVDAALSAIRARLGPVTVLVNAAGLDGFKRFNNITFEDWQRVIDVNLNGVFHTIQAVLPDMVEAGWGRIVNISSSSTHSGAPYMSHYVAAKSAVNGLTKSLALEYGPSGITVNAVPPGFIDTPMLRSAEKQGYPRRYRADHRPDPGASDGQAGRYRGGVSPSWCRRKPATSPARYWASTAAETPEHPDTGDTVKVWVDSERCQGHTLCSMIAPDSFQLSDIDGSSSAIDEVVPADQQDKVREAAQSCPEQAIIITDET